MTSPGFIEARKVYGAVMYMCIGGINFARIYDFSIGFSKCSDSVVFFVFHFIKQKSDYFFLGT